MVVWTCVINHRHNYVSRVIQLHMLFLCFNNSLHSHWESQSTLVLELHLFQTFVGICDGEASELSICCVGKCPYEVNIG